MSSSRARVGRLRTMALAVLMGGLVAAFLLGTTFPAQVTPVTGSLTGKTVSYVSSPQGSGESAFNWLFALLVAGPAVVAASMLYGASEIASASRRSARSRSSSLEVGEEV
jgi:cytochrome bd-type quinol oxidase subunit 2